MRARNLDRAQSIINHAPVRAAPSAVRDAPSCRRQQRRQRQSPAGLQVVHDHPVVRASGCSSGTSTSIQSIEASDKAGFVSAGDEIGRRPQAVVAARRRHGQFDAEHGDELVQMHRRVIWPVSGERSRSNAGGGVGRGAQLFTLPLERCGAYAEPRSAFAMCMKNLVNSHGRTERGQRKF